LKDRIGAATYGGGVLPDIAAAQESAGEVFETSFLDGAEEVFADLGGVFDLVKTDSGGYAQLDQRIALRPMRAIKISGQVPGTFSRRIPLEELDLQIIILGSRVHPYGVRLIGVIGST
jgi:hypothetical protein